MKGLSFLILFLSFFTVAVWGGDTVSAFPFPAITVDSPNGGETLTIGTSYPISWHYTGNPGQYVRIDLLKGNAFPRTMPLTIASRVPIRNGTFNWSIPFNQAVGNDYRIRVTSVNNPSYNDTSNNNFSITVPPRPTITLDSPNGGETLMAGTSQTVSWHYTGKPGAYVRIELLKGDAMMGPIANMVPITVGTFSWTIPPDQLPGSDYRIRVKSTSNPLYSDTSDNDISIAIPPPMITVDSPNGSGPLTVGTTKVIRWHYLGDPGPFVNIELLRGDAVNRLIASGVSIKSGTFGWSIPSDQALGGDYRIRVSSASDPSCNDMSDNSFTIVARGSVTDPLGDAFSSSYGVVSPDIVGITTISDGTDVTFQVRFDPQSFDATKDLVTIFVDADRSVDQNGHLTGANRFGLGIDFYVFMGSNAYGSDASIERLTGTPDNILIGSAPVTFFSDGMDVTFPLSFFQMQGIGNITSFDYRAVASIQTGENSFSGTIDMAPDGNLPPASSDSNSRHDTITPVPTSWTAAQIRQQIIDSDIDSPATTPGYLIRWNTPIEVYTGGLARVEQALTRYEVMTGGLITFSRVNFEPTNGVVYVEGTSPPGPSDPTRGGCGNVSDVPGGSSPHFRFDGTAGIYGRYYINLGSPDCNDAQVGDYESAIAEHEMGHVLAALLPHFDGFTGGEGLMNPNYFNVICNIYLNTIGTTADNLWIIEPLLSVGDFGFYY